MRPTLTLGCCAVVCILLGGVRLDATHPIYWQDLKLVPELSTLTVTGGFAGVHQEYQVDGRFGLSLDRHPHPPEFVNAQLGLVEATLRSDDVSAFFNGEDLDRLLRMTDWQGVLVDEGLLSFTGHDAQEAPITAIADLNDSHLRIRGSNLPGCCDFFNYTWDLFALHPLSGRDHAHADFDEDGDVDGDDLVSVLLNFGIQSGATHALGDADADGDVDRSDMTIWHSSVGSDLISYSTSNAAVPEPSSLMIVMPPAALFAWWLTRRRSRLAGA